MPIVWIGVKTPDGLKEWGTQLDSVPRVGDKVRLPLADPDDIDGTWDSLVGTVQRVEWQIFKEGDYDWNVEVYCILDSDWPTGYEPDSDWWQVKEYSTRQAWIKQRLSELKKTNQNHG